MHSPILALAWEFWGRHRWGLAGVAALVVAFVVVCAIAPLTQQMASVHSLWFVMGLCYVVGIFAYGFEGRLETAESGFPVRLYVLPVRTWVLVGWPMVQGMLIAVLLWLAWERFVLWPSGVKTASWWTAMLAAGVAVSQALVWLPFGLPWLRLLVAIVVLTVMARAPVFIALIGNETVTSANEGVVLNAVASTLIPIAYLAAWVGVSRARCGESPDWLRIFRTLHLNSLSRRKRPPFASAMQSQVWYEWRLRGVGYVMTVACVLALLLGLAVVLHHKIGWELNDSVLFLVIPLLIAPLWGLYSGASGKAIRSAQLTTFAATRPMTNTAIVGAKFRAAGRAALFAWAIVIITTAIWVAYCGGYRNLGRMWDTLVHRHGHDRVVVSCALFAIGAVLMTWRALAIGQWAGLTGRVWVMNAQPIVFAFITLQGLYETAMWNVNVPRRERILELLPWILTTLIALKLMLAAVSLRTLHRRGELAARTIAWILVCWCVVATTLAGVLIWLVPSEIVRPRTVVMWVILFVPLARLSVAPLALAWNRHR